LTWLFADLRYGFWFAWASLILNEASVRRYRLIRLWESANR